MQVAADGVAIDCALGAVSPIVAATDADAAHWLDAWAERGQPAVVLEPDQLSPLALDDDVADESLGSSDAGRVEQADAGQRFGGVRPVLVTEELIATADGEHRRAVFDRAAQRRALGSLQVAGDSGLLLVLAAAPEEEVYIRRNWLSHADLLHFDWNTAPLRTPPQGNHIAAVSVDIHL